MSKSLPKHICFVNPTLVLRRPIVELSRIYAEKGCNVSLLFPSKGDIDKKFHFNKNLKHKNIKLLPVKSIYSERFRFAFPNPFELISKTVKVLKENEVLHIWEYYYPHSIFPLLLRRLVNNKCKLITTTDGIIGYNYHPPEGWLEQGFKIYINTIGKIIFNIPDELTTYTEHIRKEFPKFLRKKFKVIPTGIHLDKIKFSETGRKKIRSEFKINPKTKVVLFVGMLTERKRADIVLDAAKQVPKVVFLIVGDGYQKKELLQTKETSKLNNVHILGKRKDILNLYSACDVFFLPSLGEGLPGTVMEAMSCGKPIVATHENGTIELVTNEVGILVNADGDYLGALNKALNQKFDSQKIKKQIRKFDWAIVSKEYEDVYNSK
jgi:glycosyltransferase involved in cell wall biosynthesis